MFWPTFIVATPLLEECEDDTHTPKMGTWESFGTPETSEFDCRGQNTSPWGVLHVIGKLLKCKCRKMASHEPFGHLEHKLWQKEGLGVKLAVWLPTTKSRESTRPRCVQMECDTPLKRFQQELQVCFRPHPNQRSKQRVMNSQSPRSPNRDNFRTPWESWDKKPFGCGCGGIMQRILYGEGGGFPWVRVVVSLVSPELPVACPSTKGALKCELTNLFSWFDANSNE
jgi:hypothetical protein